MSALAVTVLGTSPTSGCGAREDVANTTRRTSKAQFTPDEQACDSSRGWARQAFEYLRVALDGGGLPATLDYSIWFKNAVEASYFGHCAGLRVPPDTRVLLIEVAKRHDVCVAIERI